MARYELAGLVQKVRQKVRERAGARASATRAWFAESRYGPLTGKLLRGGAGLAIAGYLAYRLTEIGWGRILASLPTEPLFYALFLVLFLALPVTEAVIYRWILPVRLRETLPVFLKKRVFNKSLMDYSGEAYLFAWAQARTGWTRRRVFGAVKDVTLASSFASTGFAITILALFFAFGDVALLGLSEAATRVYLLVAVAVMLTLGALAYRFRRRLFSLSAKVLGLAFGLHYGRLLVMNATQLAQWEVAIPEVTVPTWLVFLGAQAVISRIPMGPAKELLFLNAGVALGAQAALPEAEIAAMLLAVSATDKVLNLVTYIAATLLTPPAAEPEGGSGDVGGLEDGK
jgi:hypothetical protein